MIQVFNIPLLRPRIMHHIVKLFLLPGDLVRRRLGISIEEDGGIIRSFVNMCVWGVLLTVLVLNLQDWF
ncbi:hypothetical protein D8780_07940 [Notoacmeibacter ruber]|uniref:Uncharacterized protein n=2 Tax=Notoacmeibacter ruber TaxID=2670375 RepID=A0A3L7JG99_9HYPH|nr:hypothetical protein D8780_07940 [Notoacmeibacter ruber]